MNELVLLLAVSLIVVHHLILSKERKHLLYCHS